MNLKTGRLISTPDFELNFDDGKEFYEEELKELENNWGDYAEIERPCSSESFRFMVDDTERLKDINRLNVCLLYALNKNGPFRLFKFAIDNSGEFKPNWFNFKQAKPKNRVNRNLRKFKMTKIKSNYDRIIHIIFIGWLSCI